MSNDIVKLNPSVEKPSKPHSVKNRLQAAFLNDLFEDWKEHGIEAIRVMRDEKPAEYVKVVASLMPKEVELDLVNYVARVPVNILDLDEWTKANQDLISKQ